MEMRDGARSGTGRQTMRPIRVGEAHPSRLESGESAGAWAAAAGTAVVPHLPRGGSPAQQRVAECDAPAGRRRFAPPRHPSRAILVTDTDAAWWMAGSVEGVEGRGTPRREGAGRRAGNRSPLRSIL